MMSGARFSGCVALEHELRSRDTETSTRTISSLRTVIASFVPEVEPHLSQSGLYTPDPRNGHRLGSRLGIELGRACFRQRVTILVLSVGEVGSQFRHSHVQDAQQKLGINRGSTGLAVAVF
jgi:hypothetical protein